MKTWISKVEKDEYGDFFITIPEELCREQKWLPGDTLVWIDNKDGSWTLKKHYEQENRFRLQMDR